MTGVLENSPCLQGLVPYRRLRHPFALPKRCREHHDDIVRRFEERIWLATSQIGQLGVSVDWVTRRVPERSTKRPPVQLRT